jgi:hypothetical protein
MFERRHRIDRKDSDEDSECPLNRWIHWEDSDSSDDDDDALKLVSPCRSYFSNRYAIGTHSAKQENMQLFASRRGNYKYASFKKQFVISSTYTYTVRCNI